MIKIKHFENNVAVVSPEKFLRLYKKGSGKYIKSVEIIPPRLDRKGFGKLKVTFSHNPLALRLKKPARMKAVG